MIFSTKAIEQCAVLKSQYALPCLVSPTGESCILVLQANPPLLTVSIHNLGKTYSQKWVTTPYEVSDVARGAQECMRLFEGALAKGYDLMYPPEADTGTTEGPLTLCPFPLHYDPCVVWNAFECFPTWYVQRHVLMDSAPWHTNIFLALDDIARTNKQYCWMCIVEPSSRRVTVSDYAIPYSVGMPSPSWGSRLALLRHHPFRGVFVVCSSQNELDLHKVLYDCSTFITRGTAFAAIAGPRTTSLLLDSAKSTE